MNKKEYQQKKSQIEKQFKTSIEDLNSKYVLQNKSLSIGDIAECSIGRGKILVSNISYSIELNIPEIQYHGFLLTKEGRRRKDGQMLVIAERHLKKKADQDGQPKSN
jgi:hypothetical protein